MYGVSRPLDDVKCIGFPGRVMWDNEGLFTHISCLHIYGQELIPCNAGLCSFCCLSRIAPYTQLCMNHVIIRKLSQFKILKIKAICHAETCENGTRSWLLCPLNPWNLPGTASLIGFRRSRGALSETAMSTVKLKSNLPFHQWVNAFENGVQH